MQEHTNTARLDEFPNSSFGTFFEEGLLHDGLPENISTEAQLWDEILKKEVLEMPFLLLPLVKETHGKSYSKDTIIIPMGTEYSVERVITKDISSIRSDIAVRIESNIFHFECESDTDKVIVKRVYEYDSQSALACSEEGTKEVPCILRFPYSAILFLEPGTTIPSNLACELCLPVYSTDAADGPDKQENETGHLRNTTTEIKCIDYAVPALKVQDYTLREISEKQLLILIPFTPIRFRTMLRQKKRQIKNGDSSKSSLQTNFDYGYAKLELTNYFREIILILDEAVASGYITESDQKYILALLRKALIRVFHKDKYLLEVVNHMTAPVLELDHEKAARLQKELDAQRPVLELEHEKAARLQKELDAQRPVLELERETVARLQKELDAQRPVLEFEHEKVARLQKELDAQRPVLELERETAARLQKELDAAKMENKALRNRLSRQKKRKKR